MWARRIKEGKTCHFAILFGFLGGSLPNVVVGDPALFASCRLMSQ